MSLKVESSRTATNGPYGEIVLMNTNTLKILIWSNFISSNPSGQIKTTVETFVNTSLLFFSLYVLGDESIRWDFVAEVEEPLGFCRISWTLEWQVRTNLLFVHVVRERLADRLQDIHRRWVSLCMCDRRGKEWDAVDKAEKERIELKSKEDGEFWYVANIKTHKLTRLSKYSDPSSLSSLRKSINTTLWKYTMTSQSHACKVSKTLSIQNRSTRYAEK